MNEQGVIRLEEKVVKGTIAVGIILTAITGLNLGLETLSDSSLNITDSLLKPTVGYNSCLLAYMTGRLWKY